MAHPAVHILEDGTIEKCHRFRKRIAGCTVTDHWETVESARIHLANKAYLAGRAATLAEFTHAEKMIHHPRRLNASFPSDKWGSSTVRRFGAQMDLFVDRNDSLPLYLWGVMASDRDAGNATYRTTVQVRTVMDKETLQTELRWGAELKVVVQSRQDRIMRNVDLDFSNHRASLASYEKLREVVTCAAVLTTPGIQWAKPDTPTEDEVVEALMGRFRDMHNAIETATARNILEVRNDDLGDFTGSSDDKIVVDVEYDRSMFSAKQFKDYFRNNLYFNNPTTVDAEIRVTDRRRNNDETLWSLYRKDGIWSVVAVTLDGVRSDNLTPTAEDVRSHVYWHVIREVNPDDQEQAFAKSQYAADLFTMVEDELALHREGAPQPR